jgi:DNA modification methylase
VAVRIINADVLDGLATLPDESVHCVVTSPPFWMLRDYGTGTWRGGDPDCDHIASTIRTGTGLAALGEHYRGGGHKAGEEKPIQFREVCGKCGARREDRQIGLEATPEEYVAALVMVFREVRRVLRKDGTLWLNLGDSYASSGGAGTTGLVADRLSRNAVLIELNPAYARVARERIIRPLPLLGSLVSLETLGEGG